LDKFRGAIQGEYEQGIFLTTSDFTKAAMEASIKKGAVPIVLLNGESIVDLMIDKEFGVRRKPLQLYDDELESLLADFDDS
jgi:restriction system protein